MRCHSPLSNERHFLKLGSSCSHKQGHFFSSFKRDKIQKNQKIDAEAMKCQDGDLHLLKVMHWQARSKGTRRPGNTRL